MSFQQTTATDWNDLVDKLHTFAVTTDGWTSAYNSTADEGTQRQIGVSKSNCFVAIGARNTENPTVNGDAIVNMALSTSLNNGVGQRKYYSHPGSLVTSATDADRIQVNDLVGPFSNVWFFSDTAVKKYVNCVVQTASDRYSHFSFGILDAVGMTHADVAYAVSAYHEWWTVAGVSNNPSHANHSMGHVWESESQVFVPSGVLPTGYPASAVFPRTQLTQTMERVSNPADHYDTASGFVLDWFFAVNNQPTTGGTGLISLPVLFREVIGGTSHVILGRLPDVRLVNMGPHTPAETLKFGSEEWLVFPWKRKGLRENLSGGSNPIATANTAEYGFAYRKIT